MAGYSTVDKVLQNKWINIEKIPDNISFRCLIKFKETGEAMSGDTHHISTGTWSHIQCRFRIDAKEMKFYTPISFYPLTVKI